MSSMQHDHNFTSKACMHAYNPMNNSVESRSKKLIFTISTEHLETNSGLYTVVKAYMLVFWAWGQPASPKVR